MLNKKSLNFILVAFLISAIFILVAGIQPSLKNQKGLGRPQQLTLSQRVSGVSSKVSDPAPNSDLGNTGPVIEVANQVSDSVDYEPLNVHEKNIKRSRFILAKALKSMSALDELKQMYQDREQIDFAINTLLAKDEVRYEPQNIIKRLDVVSFLESALAFTDNIERAYLVDRIKTLIVSYVPHNSSSERLNRSIAGDRVELVRAMMIYNPAVIDSIKSDAGSSKYAKALIDFTEKFYSANESKREKGV